jgi:hypothetical protein
VLANLHAMGYPIREPFFRYAGYDKKNKGVHHVFAVLPTNNGEIWIDPVLDHFNEHKKYFYYLDKKLPAMPLYEISGIGSQNIFKKIKHGMDVNLANAKKGAAITTQKVKKVVLKYNPLGVTGRNAFLTLLKLNAFNMAHRLYDYMHSGGESAIKSKWDSLGGNYNKLHTAITQGMRGYAARNHINLNKYNSDRKFVGSVLPMHEHSVFARHYDKHMHRIPYYHPLMSDSQGARHYGVHSGGSAYSHSIGAEPVSLTALMTAAAGVIAAFASILKAAGWSQKDKAATMDAVKKGSQDLTKKAADQVNENDEDKTADYWKDVAKKDGHSLLKMATKNTGGGAAEVELSDGADVDHANTESESVTKVDAKNTDVDIDKEPSVKAAALKLPEFHFSETLAKIPTPIKWLGGAFLAYKAGEATGIIKKGKFLKFK